MAHDPLDIVIGSTDSTRRDQAAAAKHTKAADEALAKNERAAAIADHTRGASSRCGGSMRSTA